MNRFDFISDDNFRKNLENDFRELESGLSNSLNKSVLILAGSIIEAILVDYLLSLEIEGLSKTILLKWDLGQAITKCFELKIISEKSKNLSDVVKKYRNLIHPGRAIRTSYFPDENDAIVAKSLVEIIIKEIGQKKQESYGFTAEQILSKIESDSTSEVIWHHLIKKLNTQEKKRLLISSIPDRYFELYNSVDFDVLYPDEDFENYGKFFISVYNSASVDIKNESAHKFLSVLLEGSSLEVSHYIESFFLTDYFNYYSTDNKMIVKEHLFGYIRNRMYAKLYSSIKGIFKYLSKEEFEEIVLVLLDKVTSPSDREEIDASKSLLYYEYQRIEDSRQKYILTMIDKELDYYDYSESLTKRLKDLRDNLTGDALPF